MPSVVGILAVAELKELMSTRNRPTNKFILTEWFNGEFKIDCFNLPSRDQVRRNEKTDPRHQDKQGAGNVIVENELEAPAL